MRAGRLVRRGGAQNHTGISPGTAIMTAISKRKSSSTFLEVENLVNPAPDVVTGS